MKFPSPVSVMRIAELIGAEVLGNSSASAAGINEIHRVEIGDLCFVDHPRKYPAIEPSKMPKIKDIATAIKPTLRLTLMPTISLLNISRPNLSEPNTKVLVVI